MKLPRLQFATVLVALGVPLGCASSPTPFEASLGSAEDARRANDFEKERAHFDAAIAQAGSSSDRIEAQYRRAHTWIREGALDKGAAELERLGTEYPKSTRAGRFWLDAARARERLGEFERALLNYRIVFERYPGSGGAESAVLRFVDLEHQIDPEKDRADAFRAIIRRNNNEDLEEALLHHLAKSLEATSKREAIVAYETVAKQYPLPKGRHTDEALLRSAELRRQENDFSGAVQTLQLLSKFGEDAAFIGSYRRPAYAKATFLLGLILRDDLGEADKARLAWSDLVARFPTSRLVDDALWQIVLTDRMEGKNGCNSFSRLKKEAPGSRYLHCETMVCEKGSPPPPDDGKCRVYLEDAPNKSVVTPP